MHKSVPQGAYIRFQKADDIGILDFEEFHQAPKGFPGSPNQVAPKIGEIAQGRSLEACAVGDVVDEDFHGNACPLSFKKRFVTNDSDWGMIGMRLIFSP
jgi:hypothetical protein